MSVFLTNLDDFVLPSQACINPLVASKIDGKITAEISSKIEYEEESKPDLISARVVDDKKVAAVSLSDCLACSGCVTSAEAVLIRDQGQEKFLEALLDTSLEVVVSLSPQTVASWALFLNNSDVDDVFLRVATVLKSHGARYVVDTSSTGDIVLLESREEFRHRCYNSGRHLGDGSKLNGKTLKSSWQKPCISTSVSSTEMNILEPAADGSLEFKSTNLGTVSAAELQSGSTYYPTNSSVAPSYSLPMFTSQCPEKTHPEVLPFISSIKSAQAIMGVIVKNNVFRSLLLGGDTAAAVHSSATKKVFHVSIQPCFDKKLEASRLDFYDAEKDMHEVDLVLSSTELWNTLDSWALEESQKAVSSSDRTQSVAGSEPPSAQSYHQTDYLLNVTPDAPLGRDAFEGSLRRYSAAGRKVVMTADANGGSGAVAEYLIRDAADFYCGINLWGDDKGKGQLTGSTNSTTSTSLEYVPLPPLPYVIGRNQDISEIEVKNPTTGKSLRFGKAYGFRNIQSIIRSMKRKKMELDFVEVMACPGGCLNGGGQLKLVSKKTSDGVELETPADMRDRIAKTDELFHRRTPITSVEQIVVSEANTCDSPSHRILKSRRHCMEESPLVNVLYSDFAAYLEQVHSTTELGPRVEVPGTTNPNLPSRPFSDVSLAMFHTRYHGVPKLDLVAPAAATW